MQIFKSIGSSVTLKDMNLNENEIEISGSTNAIVSCVQFMYSCVQFAYSICPRFPCSLNTKTL